jgi:hypothetical protein
MPPEGRLSDLADVLNRKFQEAKEQLRRTLFGAVISRGGLVVQDNGEVSVRTEDGVEMFFLGQLFTGGTPYRGIWMKREDASFMFYNGISDDDPSKVFFAWADRSNNILVSDDAESGVGLARPWIPMPTVPVLSTMIPTTSSGTYTSIYSTGWVLKQQPSCEVQALLLSSGGGIGNAQFTINGTPAGSAIPIASGAFGWSALQQLTLPGPLNGYVRVELQVQRTNAAGTVGGVLVATQRQS